MQDQKIPRQNFPYIGGILLCIKKIAIDAAGLHTAAVKKVSGYVQFVDMT